MILSIDEIKNYIDNDLNFPKVFLTNEELSKLRQVNLVVFLKWFDPSNLVYSSGTYRLFNNRSCCLNYCWAKDFSTGESCSAINFLQKYYNYTFYQSAYILYCFLRSGFVDKKTTNSLAEKKITKDDIILKFRTGELKPIDGIRNIYAYLIFTRGFDVGFIDHLKENNYLLAEDLGGKIKNIVFPHFENQINSITNIIGYDVCGTLSDDEKSFRRCTTTKAFSNYSIYSDFFGESELQTYYIFDSDLELLSFYYLYYNGYIKIETDDFALISLRGHLVEILENYISNSKNSIIYNCTGDQDLFSMLEDNFNSNNVFLHNVDLSSHTDFKKWNEIILNIDKLDDYLKNKLLNCFM